MAKPFPLDGSGLFTVAMGYCDCGTPLHKRGERPMCRYEVIQMHDVIIGGTRYDYLEARIVYGDGND